MLTLEESSESKRCAGTASFEWIETICLNCNGNDQAVVKFERTFSLEELNHQIFSARRVTEHYHYRILECKGCGLVFSSPILPPAKLSELYRMSEFTYQKEVADIAATYIRYLRQHEHVLEAKSNALEIGCGSGFFLRELSRFGFAKVSGVEPSEDAVSKAGDLRSRIYTGLFEDADIEPCSLDLICCFQTLDHVVDPLKVLEKAYTLLRPGGIVYVIVHNERAFQARLFGKRSPIYDVEHIYLFNPSTLPMICRKAGFEPVHVFNVANTYPLEYWLECRRSLLRSFC